jgi:hypothetical protein
MTGTRTAATFSSLFPNPFVGSKISYTFHPCLRRGALAVAECGFSPITLLDAFHDGSVLGAHTGDPRRWVGSPLLILLALFRCTLLERLFFLTPGPCASFKSRFKEFLFLLFFQTVFVELWEPEIRSRGRSFRGTYLIIRCVNKREGRLFLQ